MAKDHLHSADSPSRPRTPIIGNDEIEVSARSDLTVSILGNKSFTSERRLVHFKVERQALISNSRYFSANIRFNANNNQASDIKLEDDDVDAMHVWFLYMQAAHEQAVTEDDEYDRGKKQRTDHHGRARIDDKLFRTDVAASTDINRIWHIINAADKYDLDATILRGFFNLWYGANVHISSLDDNLARQVALPCYMFDHAEGFAAVTKWLAYNHAGHITEKRPYGFKWNHVHMAPPEFTGPMNHARGALRTVIHRGIWDRIGELLERGPYACKCGKWAETAGYYFASLVKTDAYPLEKTFSRASVIEILNRLKNFHMQHRGSCSLCSVDWDEEVARARVLTLRNFDGLCIDCMDRSRPKRENTDVDYWRQLESIDGRWDENCRVRHDEPTWYISWCGRAEHRAKLIERHREVNRGDYRG